MLTKEQVEEIRRRTAIGVPLDDIVILGKTECDALCDSHDELQQRLAAAYDTVGIWTERHNSLGNQVDELQREVERLEQLMHSPIGTLYRDDVEKLRAMMKAWNKWCETDEFKNALRWANETKYDDGRQINYIQREQHAKGSMWLAFTKGMEVAEATLAQQSDKKAVTGRIGSSNGLPSVTGIRTENTRTSW